MPRCRPPNGKKREHSATDESDTDTRHATADGPAALRRAGPPSSYARCGAVACGMARMRAGHGASPALSEINLRTYEYDHRAPDFRWYK